MVYCICNNCYAKDMKLENDKYLVCNKCGNRQYLRNLDLEFEEEES